MAEDPLTTSASSSDAIGDRPKHVVDDSAARPGRRKRRKISAYKQAMDQATRQEQRHDTGPCVADSPVATGAFSKMERI